MANLKGFNPTEVTTSINAIQKAYNNLYAAIGTKMQNEFINGMQDKWACNDAQTFFSKVKTSMDQIITNSNITFQSVADAMNSGARNWANQTGSSWSNVSFSVNDTKMNVSNIQENINGIRGVDPEATTVANKLPLIANEAENALTEARNAVNNCGFIGGNSATNLQSSLTTIKNNINEIFSTLSNDCKTAITNTADNYTNLETSVAAAFAGKN